MVPLLLHHHGMKQRLFQPLTLGLLVTLLSSSTVLADQVLLDNGDRLTGTVTTLQEGTLTLETGYAGDVEIDWSRVSGLTTDAPVAVVLADGSELSGTLAGDGEGSVELTPEDQAGALTFPLDQVTALNPPVVPAVRYRGGVSVAVTSTSGNTESDRTYAEGELVAQSDSNRVSFTLQVNEAEEDGRKTASRNFAAVGYDQFFGERWYLAANGSAAEDEFQDLKLRTTLGLAAGYRFSDTEAFRLSGELGASYVNEDFDAAPDSDYPAGRWALDLSRRLGDGGAELFHDHEVLVSLDDSDDVLLRTRTGVRFSLWEGLVAALQLNYDRDEEPAPGREEEDRTWSLTLGYTW